MNETRRHYICRVRCWERPKRAAQPWFKSQLLLPTESLELWYWREVPFILCYNITHRETFEGENFRKFMEKNIFVVKTFTDCSPVLPKDVTPPNFADKICTNSHKISKIFSLESFRLHNMCQYARAPMAQLVSFSDNWFRHSTVQNTDQSGELQLR